MPKPVNVRVTTIDAELEFAIQPNTTGKPAARPNPKPTRPIKESKWVWKIQMITALPIRIQTLKSNTV